MSHTRNSGLYLAGRVVPAAIGLGGVAFYTRLLEPAVIGEVALLVSTAHLVSATVYTWLRIAALRIVAGSDETDIPKLFATILMLFVGVSAMLAPIIATALHFYQPNLAVSSLALTAAGVVALGWFELNASLLQARLSFRSWSVLNLVRAVGGLGASMFLISIGWKTNALLTGFLLSNCTALIFVTLWSPATRGSFDVALSRRCFRFGWPQSLNAAQTYAAPVGQRWIVDAGVGAIGLGIFSVAQDFGSAVLARIVESVSIAGIPLAFRAKDRGDSAALQAQLRANARLSFAVGLPATVGLCVLAVPISHWMFGQKFWDGASVILSLAAVAAFAINMRVYYFDQAFELAMQTRPQAIISLVGTVFAIGGCGLLVPRYGAIGAAGSAFVTSFVCLGLSIWWGSRVLPMPIPVSDWLKTAFATGGMGLALFIAPRSPGLGALALQIAGGCLLYFVLSTATRPHYIRAYFSHRFPALGR